MACGEGWAREAAGAAMRSRVAKILLVMSGTLGWVGRRSNARRLTRRLIVSHGVRVCSESSCGKRLFGSWAADRFALAVRAECAEQKSAGPSAALTTFASVGMTRFPVTYSGLDSDLNSGQ